MNDSVHYGAYDSSFADTTEDANFTHDHTNPVRTVLVTSDQQFDIQQEQLPSFSILNHSSQDEEDSLQTSQINLNQSSFQTISSNIRDIANYSYDSNFQPRLTGIDFDRIPLNESELLTQSEAGQLIKNVIADRESKVQQYNNNNNYEQQPQPSSARLVVYNHSGQQTPPVVHAARSQHNSDADIDRQSNHSHHSQRSAQSQRSIHSHHSEYSYSSVINQIQNITDSEQKQHQQQQLLHTPQQNQRPDDNAQFGHQNPNDISVTFHQDGSNNFPQSSAFRPPASSTQNTPQINSKFSSFNINSASQQHRSNFQQRQNQDDSTQIMSTLFSHGQEKGKKQGNKVFEVNQRDNITADSMAQSLYRPFSSKQNEQVVVLVDEQNSYEPNIIGNESSSEQQFTKVPPRQLRQDFDSEYEEVKIPQDARVFASDNSKQQSASRGKTPDFGRAVSANNPFVNKGINNQTIFAQQLESAKQLVRQQNPNPQQFIPPNNNRWDNYQSRLDQEMEESTKRLQMIQHERQKQQDLITMNQQQTQRSDGQRKQRSYADVFEVPNQPKRSVTASEMKPYFSSKEDLYRIIAIEGQYYVPPKKQCTLAFMRDIMFGNKKVFHTKQIHMVNVPSHEELALKHVLEEIKEIPRFVEYLPNLTGGKVNVCKQFIFNIINTIDENYFITNILNGYKMRKIKNCDKKEEKFEMPTFMYKLLVNSNQISRKKGKALSYIMSDKERQKPDRSNRTRYERATTFANERDHIIENRAAQQQFRDSQVQNASHISNQMIASDNSSSSDSIQPPQKIFKPNQFQSSVQNHLRSATAADGNITILSMVEHDNSNALNNLDASRIDDPILQSSRKNQQHQQQQVQQVNSQQIQQQQLNNSKPSAVQTQKLSLNPVPSFIR